MKYNLKTRPFRTDFQDDEGFVLATIEWFEGFEKELKEIKRQWDGMEISMTLGWLIWEVLGEKF